FFLITDIQEIPENIKYLKSLQSADFSSNPLSKLPAGFVQLRSLTVLGLNDVSLTQLPHDFGSLSNLVSLELRENYLKGLPLSFAFLVKLERLDLGSNDFEELPVVVGQLSSLQELWLDSNELSTLPKEIGQLRRLMCLDVSENKLSHLPDELCELESLTDLHLSQNYLEALPEDIGRLRKLTIFKVDQNRLGSLPESIGDCVSLQELILTDNLLTELPTSIGRLVNLNNLNADCNQLSELPAEIGQLVRLGVLSLRENCLQRLPPETGTLRRLHVLDVSGNRLQNLPLTVTALNLKALWLAKNQTQFVRHDTPHPRELKARHQKFVQKTKNIDGHVMSHSDEGIFISRIAEGGAAARDGKLRVGDRVLSINGIDMDGVRHDQAVAMLTGLERFVRLVVQREELVLRDPNRPQPSLPTAMALGTSATTTSRPYGGSLYSSSSYMANRPSYLGGYKRPGPIGSVSAAGGGDDTVAGDKQPANTKTTYSIYTKLPGLRNDTTTLAGSGQPTSHPVLPHQPYSFPSAQRDPPLPAAHPSEPIYANSGDPGGVGISLSSFRPARVMPHGTHAIGNGFPPAAGGVQAATSNPPSSPSSQRLKGPLVTVTIQQPDPYAPLAAEFPPAPKTLGRTTEVITRTTLTETTTTRVTNNILSLTPGSEEDVTLVKAGGPLGLSIIGGTDHPCHPFGADEPGIFVSKIVPDGAASKCARLRVGDRLLKVNGMDVTKCTHQEAVMALLDPSYEVVLSVRHDPLPSGWQELVIQREPGEKLGMNIKGGVQGHSGNPADPSDESIFISKINTNGAALRDGRLKPGMRIVEVNGLSLLGATHQEAVNILRTAGDTIRLVVCDGYNAAAAMGEGESPQESSLKTAASVSSIDHEDEVTVALREEKMKKERDADSHSLHSFTSVSSQHSGKALATLPADGKAVAVPADSKSVEQRVMEVVRAAEQLVSPALAAAATSVAPPTAVPVGEQKTTTVIMTKKSVSHPPASAAATLQGFVAEPESLTFIEKKHHFESMQQQHQQAPEAKRFSFLSESELQKMREEQESKRDGRWLHQDDSGEEEEDDEKTEGDEDLEMPPSVAHHAAETEVDSPLSMETGPMRQVPPVPAVRTLKAERRLQERQQQLDEEQKAHPGSITDAEQRALEAEKRSAWRQARMKSLEEDVVQAQAMLAHMTEGVEARPVSPIFKAVNINIDEVTEQQVSREQRRDDDENSNNLEHPELYSDREQSLGHKALLGDEELPRLVLTLRDGQTCTVEREHVVDETVSRRIERVIDPQTGEARLRTLEFVEKVVEKEIETTTEKILSLELHGRHEDGTNDNGNCEEEAGGDEGDLPSPTSDQGSGPALAKKKKRRRSKRR
ncbi:hypothetical protein V5799_024242, partial [Amblyomma americanum]